MLQKRPNDQLRRSGNWGENAKRVTLKNGSEVEMEKEEEKTKKNEKDDKQGKSWKKKKDEKGKEDEQFNPNGALKNIAGIFSKKKIS